MSKNRDLITALIVAEKHFAKSEYEEGLARQTEALALLDTNPPQGVIELLAIHFCRAGYLVMTTPDINQEKYAPSGSNPELAIADAIANYPQRIKNTFTQLEKGYEWTQKLNLTDIDRDTRIFLAQSRFAEATFKVFKPTITKPDGSKTNIELPRSLEEAIKCVAQAQAIMRSIPTQQRKEEDLLYIKSYSLMKRFAKTTPEKFGFADMKPVDYDESALSETETEELMRPLREQEEQRNPSTPRIEIDDKFRITIVEQKTKIKQRMNVNNSIKISAEIETSEKLFADKAKALLHFQPEKLVGTMFHLKESPKEKSELTHNLSYQITRS